MARIVIQVANGKVTRVLSDQRFCGVVVEEVMPVFPGDDHAKVKLDVLTAAFDPDEVSDRYIEMARQRSDQRSQS